MCPTCGHTVQKVNDGVNPKTWWCPRCGTLTTDGIPQFERPSYLRTVMANLQNCDDSIPRSEPGPLTGVLWAKVSHLFALGSTSATELCKALGFDPEYKRKYY